MHETNDRQKRLKSQSESRNRRLIHLSVLVGYLILTLVMTWPLAQNFTSAIPGDGFDGWQNYWNLWWVKIALVDRVQNPLVTDLLYFPTGVGLYFHTLNPFNGLVTLPIQLAAGLIAAYNAVVLISWTLGGYGVFLLTLWLSKLSKREKQRVGLSAQPQTRSLFDLRSLIPYIAAFIAGAIFTFSPFHMAHLLGHMQVMSLQWIAFYVLYLLMALKEVQQGKPWLRHSMFAGLFLVLTGLCDWYFVLYLFIFTFIALVWLIVYQFISYQSAKRDSDKTEPTDSSISTRRGATGWLLRLLGPPLVAGSIFAVVMSPWLFPMVDQTIRFDFMERPQSDLYILSASVMDFLIPNRLHTLFRPESAAWIGNQVAPVSERTISIGYMALLLAGVGLIARPRRAAFWGIAALIFLLLALGPIIHLGNITWADIPTTNETLLQLTPMGILNYFLPIASISRSISRFALMVQLSIAVLAGLGVGVLLGKLHNQWTILAVSGLLLAISLAESWVAPYPISPPDTPAYYERLAIDGNEGAILNLPMNYDRPGYLLYQTVHQQPLTVAYISRDDPRTLTERIPVLQHFRHLGPDIIGVNPSDVGQTVLFDIGVDTVVLDRYKMPGGLEREYTTALATEIFTGLTPTYEDDRITVYAATQPEHAEPYMVLGAENWGTLEVAENGSRSRMLMDGVASLHLHHMRENVPISIQYRTEPGVMLALTQEQGSEQIILPPAPEGNVAVVKLAADESEIVTVILKPSAADSVWIERVGFEE